MKNFFHLPRLGLLLVGLALLAGCSLTPPPLTSTPIPTITFTPAPTQTQTPTVTTPGDWEQLRPGVERRVLEIVEDGEYIESLYILRLEPGYFQFDVAYDPEGLTLAAWQERTGALIVVNGGYFRQEDEQYFPNGLTVIDGIPMGDSYGDFGGMFAVTGDGPELRWLAHQLYDPNEQLLAALQSFPILVKPGGELGFPAQHEDNIIARRTAIGQDQHGRILLIVAPQGNLTLHQLSAHLTKSELELDMAINLDGGPSSGILISEPEQKIPAISPLPVVIIISSR